VARTEAGPEASAVRQTDHSTKQACRREAEAGRLQRQTYCTMSQPCAQEGRTTRHQLTDAKAHAVSVERQLLYRRPDDSEKLSNDGCFKILCYCNERKSLEDASFSHSVRIKFSCTSFQLSCFSLDTISVLVSGTTTWQGPQHRK
jgi:hypothetical protein